MSGRFACGRALRAFILAFVAAALPIAAPPPARAATFSYAMGTSCTMMTVTGRTIMCDDGKSIALDASVTPSCPQFALALQGGNYTLVCAAPNATGLWWRAEDNGRGTWLSHQGDTIFAVDYAYDNANLPRWRTLIATKRDDGTFVGSVYETRGPSFAVPFETQLVSANPIGDGWIALDDADHVRVDMAEGNARALVRQQFGPVPACSFGLIGNPATIANYTDLWWNAAESGWGVNLAHQGDTIFAAWYTYNTDGTPLFLVATTQKSGSATYSGDLYRATGPAGPAMQATKVGSATLNFATGNSANFTYTAQVTGMAVAATQSKPITRQIFAAPGAACQ